MTTKTKTKEDSLGSLKKNGSSGRAQCPRCRKKQTKGFLQMAVSKYGDERSARGAKHVTSKSKSLCGSCLAGLYRHLESEFDKYIEGE